MTSTGISAADRAATVRAAIDPDTKPSDLAQPGHMFPLRARRGGVLVRAGQTEAAVDLARLAGPLSGRRDLRNHERRRHHGAGEAVDALRAQARAAADHDRGSDQVPHAQRPSRQADCLRPAADRPRLVPGLCLRERDRRGDARGRRQGRHRRRTGHPGAGPLALPDGRRVPLVALRLRPGSSTRRCNASRRRDAACSCI